MACDNITDYLVQESGRFGPEIYERVFPVSPWIGLVRRGEFPQEMGDQISNLTYERSAPATTTDWTEITVSEGDGVAGGNCLPVAVKVAVGSTTRSYKLKRRVLEGPDFCVTDLQFKFQLRKQLEAIMGILAGYTQIEWEERYKRDYSTLVQNHTVVDATWNTTGTTTDGSGYAAEQATSTLTQGVLNYAKAKLLRDGAIFSALGKRDGMAILTLICSYETHERLIRDNADIRQDVRWGAPDKLLAGYGVNGDYRNFYHVTDPYPRRFSYANGTYTEIAPFDTVAATKGTKARVNPLWEAALYEESVIFDPEVFHSLIPRPITNPAPNFQFDPVTYLGDWRLKNILDRVCNPDGTIVYHRGHLGHAPEPVHPERGWAFIHLRCDPAGNLVTSCT